LLLTRIANAASEAPKDAAVFLRALEAARDSLWERTRDEDGGSAGPRPQPPTSAEIVRRTANAFRR
jgi:hypothetical protein